ncbi:MAG: hypothetical protein JWR69_3164, partial [Pedosphaera sp.]|nr:hypothetical protein [Pedosphaera sp.]
MKITTRLLLTLGIIAGFAARLSAANIVLNELMYHPASENLSESYVEVFNAGPGTVDLTGWRFTKGIQYAFPSNTLFAPGAYLVVAADRSAFTNKYPSVTNFVAGWPAPMGSDVRLEDNTG